MFSDSGSPSSPITTMSSKPHPEPTGPVDARLHREGMAGPQELGVSRHQVGVLVLLDADSVARSVDEQVAESGLLDDRPGHPVDMLGA